MKGGIINAREMQVEFERRITLMNPAFELKEKLSSDTIFSFLNAYTERFVRTNYLAEDGVIDGTRAQKKNADTLKGLIVRELLSTKLAEDTKNTDVNSAKFVLPADYFLYIRSNSKVSATYKGLVKNIAQHDVINNKAINYFISENSISTGSSTGTYNIVYDGNQFTIVYVSGTEVSISDINKITFYMDNTVVKVVTNYGTEGLQSDPDKISKIFTSIPSLRFNKIIVSKDSTAVITLTLKDKSYVEFSNLDVNNNNIIDFLETVPNSTIREDDVEKVISTYFNRSIIRSPYVVLNAGRADDVTDNIYLNVIHDTYTVIEAVDLVYYRKPKRFDVIGVDGINVLDHCELPDNVHLEIVEGAVEMFITEAKYRLSSNQNNNQQ